MKPQSNDAAKRNETLFKTPAPAKEQQGNRPVRDGNCAFPFPTSTGAVSEGSPSFGATQVGNQKYMSQHEYRNPSPIDFVKPQNRIPQQVELNLPPPAEQTNSGSACVLANRRFGKSVTMTRNMTPTESVHHKHQMTTNGIFSGGLSNDNKVSTGVNNKMFDVSTNQMSGAAAKGSQQPTRQQSQSHVEQVQLMRNCSEKARTQHNTNAAPDVSSPQFGKSEDRSNASVAAARAWMSIGVGGNNTQTSEKSSIHKSSQISAESLYNSSRKQLYQQAFKPKCLKDTQLHPQRNGFPFQTLVHQPVHKMLNPSSDLTRLHVQSPWRGHITPHVQLKQRRKNLNLPPDLNIRVNSLDSPTKQSSGIHVDSQQPDLALQL